MNNYYKVGGSLKFDHPSYVVRQADKDLYESLKIGEYCFILNSRQMGKSSLRVRMTKILRNEGFFCAFLDLTLIGVNVSQEQWYKSICRQILDSLELEEINLNLFWQEFHGLTEVQRFQNFLELILVKIKSKLIVFIDEIDSLIRISFKDDFLALIRGCYNLRVDKKQYENLCFCLLGVASPSDLIQDKTRTPFNIGKSINLSGITFKEAKNSLLTGLLKFSNPEKVLKEILAWTGGQPFLSQKVCYLLSENCQDLNPDIAEIIREYVIKNWSSQDYPEHLRTIRDRLLFNEQKTLQLLDLYSQILTKPILANETPEQITLRLTGIAVNKQGYLQVYNPIYKQVFNQDWLQEQLNNLRPYYQEINQWIASNYQTDYLLKGENLSAALFWSQNKTLSQLDYQFLSASQAEKDRQKNQILREANQKAEKLIKRGGIILGLTSLLSIFIAITTTIYSQHQLNIVTESIRLEKAGMRTIQEFDEKQLDALVSAMKAGQDLQKLLNSQSSFYDYPALNPVSALLIILNQIQEVNQLKSHQKGVKTVAFSPNGNLIVTGSNDGSIKLWKTNGSLIKTLNPSANNSPINHVEFSADNQLIAAANMEGMLTIWAKEGNLINNYNHGEAIYTLSFSPDYQRIATTGYNGVIKIWHINGNFLKSFVNNSSIYTLIFTPNGQQIITGDNQGIITFWDLQGSRIKSWQAHGDIINNIALTSDGKLLASASGDTTVKIWENDGTLLQTLKGHKQSVRQVIFSRDNQKIITASLDKTIKLWTLEGTLKDTLTGHTDSVYSISLSPDNNLLASASEDTTIKLWNLADSSSNLMQQREEIIQIKFNRDSKSIVAGSLNGLIQIWELDQKISHQWIHQQTLVTSMDLNLDKQILVLGQADGTITLMNSQGMTKSLKAHQQEITNIRISPDNNLIVSADEIGIIKLWNKEGNLLKSFNSAQGFIKSLEFSPDGSFFISVNEQGIIKFWHSQGTIIKTLNKHKFSPIKTIKFNPKDQTLALASYRGLITIMNQEKILKEIITDAIDEIRVIEFSPDGNLLAIGGENGKIELWKIQQHPTFLLTIEQSNLPITSLSFSSDNQALIAGDIYGNIRLWHLNLKHLLKQGCHWLKDYWLTNTSLQTTLPTCQATIVTKNE